MVPSATALAAWRWTLGAAVMPKLNSRKREVASLDGRDGIIPERSLGVPRGGVRERDLLALAARAKASSLWRCRQPPKVGRFISPSRCRAYEGLADLQGRLRFGHEEFCVLKGYVSGPRCVC